MNTFTDSSSVRDSESRISTAKPSKLVEFFTSSDFFLDLLYVLRNSFNFLRHTKFPVENCQMSVLILEHRLNQSVIRVIFYKSITCEKSLEKELRFIAPIVFPPKNLLLVDLLAFLKFFQSPSNHLLSTKSKESDNTHPVPETI